MKDMIRRFYQPKIKLAGRKLPLQIINEKGDCEYIFGSKPDAGLVRGYLIGRKKLPPAKWKWRYDELLYLYDWTRDDFRDSMRSERLSVDSLSVCEERLHKTHFCGRLGNREQKKSNTLRGITSIIRENEGKFYTFDNDIKFAPPIIYGLHLIGDDTEMGDFLMSLEEKGIRYIKDYFKKSGISIDLKLRMKEKSKKNMRMLGYNVSSEVPLLLPEDASFIEQAGREVRYGRSIEEKRGSENVFELLSRNDSFKELKF